MEDILRWGTQDLFQAREDSEDHQTAAQSGDQAIGAAQANDASATAAARESTGNAEASHYGQVGPSRMSAPPLAGLRHSPHTQESALPIDLLAGRCCRRLRSDHWLPVRLSFCFLLLHIDSGIIVPGRWSSRLELRDQDLQALTYKDASLDSLLQRTIGPGITDLGGAEGLKPGNSFGPGLEHVLVRVWSDQKELSVDAEDEGQDLPPWLYACSLRPLLVIASTLTQGCSTRVCKPTKPIVSGPQMSFSAGEEESEEKEEEGDVEEASRSLLTLSPC